MILFLGLTFIYSCQSNYDISGQYINDFDEGVELSKSSNKPMLVVFDLWSNPIRSTFNLFKEDEIAGLLENYVVVWLMVDEKKTNADGQNIGSVNARIQEKLRLNNQPCYVILDSNLNRLKEPIGYTDKTGMINFLRL